MRYVLVRTDRHTLEQFAALTGLHPDLIRRLVVLGLIEAGRDPAGELWFPRGQVAAVARLQRLHAGFALNYAALGLVTDLLDRIAALEAALRTYRRPVPLNRDRALPERRTTAMSDLIVIGYPDEQTAQRAWEELTKLQRDYLIDLEDAAIIRRDRDGKLHVTTPAHHAVAWGTLSGLFWGVLLGLLLLGPLAPVVGAAGGIMGAAIGVGTDMGIKEDFRQRVQEMVQPGTSALVVIVRRVTPDKFTEALRPYGGTVLQTSLPHDAEQQLMKALHGDDPNAPTWQQDTATAA